MADTMMQLAVARRAAEILGLPVSGGFLLGAVAPDCVRIRENSGREDYASAHALTPGWRESWAFCLEQLPAALGNPYWTGCLFHLMTDCLWVTYRQQLMKRLPESMPEEEKRALLRQETEALERILYLQEGGRTLFRAIVSTPLPRGRGPLGLDPGEVDLWRRQCDSILKTMKHDQPLNLLTAAATEAFLQRAANRISREVRRARQGGNP